MRKVNLKRMKIKVPENVTRCGINTTRTRKRGKRHRLTQLVSSFPTRLQTSRIASRIVKCTKTCKWLVECSYKRWKICLRSTNDILMTILSATNESFRSNSGIASLLPATTSTQNITKICKTKLFKKMKMQKPPFERWPKLPHLYWYPGWWFLVIHSQ